MGKLSMDLYLISLSKRYRAASKPEKGKILNELCESSGFHKKHAIRLLNSYEENKRYKTKKKKGRPTVYPSGLYLAPLKRIWLASDQPCGKRLKTVLRLWLPHYGCTYEALDPAIYKGLLSMSAATIDRLLAPSRIKCKRFCGTKPGRIFSQYIAYLTTMPYSNSYHSCFSHVLIPSNCKRGNPCNVLQISNIYQKIQYPD